MRLRRLLIPALAAVLCGGAATAAYAHSHNDLDDVRHATAKYQDLHRADHDGYSLLVDAKGVACIDMPGMGGMGVHYVNGTFAGDDKLNPLTPEAVVYEPDRAGQPHLVAVEYVVFQSVWQAAGHKSRPKLFGRKLDFTPSPNRYGLPAFYSLHAWVWKQNPAGTFAMWNPRVKCPGATASADGGGGHAGHSM
jgi:hypothetical protein